MANKMTPISQDVVVTLKARTSEIENSIKSLMQKLQGTNLSDSFTKSYSSSLQKVLDKSQELKKTIGDTNSVNSKTVSNWSNSYSKLAAELTKTIAKIEGHSVKFSDLVSFDSSEYKQLKNALDTLRVARENIYSKKNIEKNMPKIAEGVITQKTIGSVRSNIDDQKEITRILNEQLVGLNKKSIAEQDGLDILNQKLVAYKAILAVDNNLAKLDARRTVNKAALEYARQQTDLPKTATKQDIATAWTAGNFSVAKKDIDKVNKSIPDVTTKMTDLNSKVAQLTTYKQDVLDFAQRLSTDFQATAQPLATAENALEKFRQAEINAANVDLDEISTDVNQIKTSMQGAEKATEDYTDSLVQLEARQTFFSDLQSKITQIFGLANAFQGLRRFVQESWTAIKELDAAFTEIAVVTEFTTGDLWKSFDTYNKMAQQLGVTTTDAIETSALYYQQGLDTADVMTLTTETIKMARIANMDFATATQAMTSAIRGFKLEMSDAQSITDVYSALAAEAAVDTDQLATAISKTASIAGSAGLTLEDTSAFLTQIIETTQEAPETAGTALKTIIARFTELKKNPATLTVEVEGEEVSANKVEEALKTANVALRDTEGNFRDLGDVFLELSSKWNGLDRNTQRYIATTAAGSRQQSRFIAMMDNYKRTMELVGIANDSAGAGAIQFAKTLDSVSARVNKLKSNFEALIGNLVENDTVKAILDTLNEGMTILVNASEKGIVAFGALIFMVGKAIKSALTLIVSQFANVEKKNEELRAKIGKIIKTTVLYQPDLTLVNEANKQLKIDPITVGVGTTSKKIDDISGTQTYTKLQQKKIDLQNQYAKSYNNVITKQKIYQKMLKSEAQYTLNDASGMSQAYIQNAKKAVDAAIDESRTATWKLLTPTIATTVGSGFIQGMMTGIISGDWKVGLATGIISTFSSALSNPAITRTIGSMFTKSGGTIAKALAGIGSKVAAAVPYALIAAGVAAIGYGLYKWFDPVQRANRELKKAQDNLDNINNKLEKSKANFLSDVSKVKQVSDDITLYKKLQNQVGLTTDEQTELNNTITSLAEQFPQIVTGYTAAGQVIIDQKTNWEEILKLQRESISLSQAQYASDVMGVVEAKKQVRTDKINDIQAKKKQTEEMLSTYGVRLNWDEDKLEYIWDLTDAITAIYVREIENYDAQLNALTAQKELYDQETINAEKQIASSLINNFQSAQIGSELPSEMANAVQGQLATKIKGLNLDWDTKDEDTKNANIAEAQAEADAFLLALQTSLENTKIDMSKVAENMATMTEEDFKSYLESKGITANGTNAELYATLVLDFQTKNAGVQEVLDIISGKTEEKKYNNAHISDDIITSVIDRETIAAAAANMGEVAGANYISRLYAAVKYGSLSPEVANYLGTLNIATEEAAKQAAAYLTSTFDMDYETAVDVVLRYKNDEDELISKERMFSSTGIQSYFDDQQDINSADQALKTLNTGAVDLPIEQTKALVEEFPELSGALKVFANNADKSTDAIKTLKEAITKATDNKKSIEYFKKLSEQIEIIKDISSADYAKEASKSVIKDSLGISDLEDADELIDTYMSDIEAAANGNVDAWNRVQSAIKQAKLAAIGFGTLTAEQQASVTSAIDDIITELDLLSSGEYGATFRLDGIDETGAMFQSVIDSLTAVNISADDAMKIIGVLGGLKIEPIIERVAVPMPIKRAGDDDRAVFRRNKGMTTVPRITYKVIKDNTYNPGYVGRKSGGGGGGGGGGGKDYETKTGKYYNEINAIKKLNTQLEKLADLRDKGNLSPEEYRNNLNQTAKYYKDLQNNLHNYSESLRKDQASLAAEITNLKAPNAINIVNGVLKVNKDAISALSSTTREKIDDMIDNWEKLSKTLEENSDGWWKAKYALEELADKYRDSFTSTEDRIRDVLIKQDQDKIDDAKKKYDKLKEADDDYLKALKDNIRKRRNARDKETDYNDLAKKEKRLALLKRDTSGIYGAEILSLEEEIAQSRKELSDKEVDDMVDSLEEQATKRADAYDKELKELQDLQEDKEKTMIEYNKKVDKIMQSGAENILEWLQTYDKEYITASETAQQKYLESWKATINEANGYVNNVINGAVTTSQDVAAQKAQGVYSAITEAGYSKGAADIQSHDATGAYAWYNSFIKGREDLSEDVKKLFWQIVLLKYQWAGTKAPSFPGYSRGGIVNSTGLAMVHGTTTKPEAFLSAADTKNFQILMELLNKAVNYKGGTQSDVPNALQIGECQIIVEVGNIADDYDVDQAIDKVKQSIVDNSNYRNVNIVTRKK